MLTIEVLVLQCINNVKTADPTANGYTVEDGHDMEHAGHDQISSHRGQAQAQTEYQVAERGKALGVAVSQNNQEGDRAKVKANRVDKPRRKDKQGTIHQGECQCLSGTYPYGRYVAGSGAWI